MAAWSSEASSMFFALRTNAKNQARSSTGDLDAVASMRKNGIAAEQSKAVRDLALVGRALAEIWRNGWESEGETGAQLLNAADAAVAEALSLDADINAGNSANVDYYPLWKRGYVDRYRARSAPGSDGWAATMTKSLQSYEAALKAKGVTPHARRSILVDQAETLVYAGAATAAVEIIERVLKENYHNDRSWHVWAFAFALHHAGEPDRAADWLERVFDRHDEDDLYNNDMRLMLAAAHQESGGHKRAVELMQKFTEVQIAKGETPWTLAREIERGAFQPGSKFEADWQNTLADAGLS
jgi:tetratricopeptide (TPR) repeat protein